MKLKGVVLAALLAVALVPAAAMAYDYDGWSIDYDLWEADYDTEALGDYDDDPDYDALEYDEDIDDAYYDEYGESDDEYGVLEDEAAWESDDEYGEYDDAWAYDEDWDAAYEEDPEYNEDADSLNAYDGTYWYGDRLETWYSSEDAYHYQTDEWWVDDEGFYRTDEGYYVIAASDYEYGSVIDGSKGACFVADSGCEEGVSDYYVDW